MSLPRGCRGMAAKSPCRPSSPNPSPYGAAAALAALAFAILLTGPAAAQSTASPVFSLEKVDSPLLGEVPADVRVTWVYSFPNAAMAAGAYAFGNAQIHWDPPRCDDPAVVVTGALTQSIALSPGVASYQGQSTFQIARTKDFNATGATCAFSGFVEAVGPYSRTPPAAISGYYVVPPVEPADAEVGAQADANQAAPGAPVGAIVLALVAAVGVALVLRRRV